MLRGRVVGLMDIAIIEHNNTSLPPLPHRTIESRIPTGEVGRGLGDDEGEVGGEAHVVRSCVGDELGSGGEL